MKIALVGLGTTGNIVAEYLLKEKALVAVLCRKESAKIGKDVGEVLNRPSTGIIIESTENLEEVLRRSRPEVVIDFSSPEFLSENLSTLAKCRVNVVTAVTGYNEIETSRIKMVARNRKLGVVMAPNISYGVNVLMAMARIAAQLHRDYDFQIVEENHRKKKDSPSGTAYKIAETMLALIGAREQTEPIPIHSIRTGDVAGRHTVLISGKYDQIEITHTAFSRNAFAEGAFKAAQFIVGRTGFYEMKDVFRLEHEEGQARRWQSSAYNEEDEWYAARYKILQS